RRVPRLCSPPNRHGVPEGQPLPDHVHLRQRGRRIAPQWRPQSGRARQSGPGKPEASRLMGRSEGLPGRERREPFRGPAAAALHRKGARGQARGPPDGRAVLRPRSHRDCENRGPDFRPEEGLHVGRRDAQHATGGPRVRDDRLYVSRETHRGQQYAGAVRATARDLRTITTSLKITTDLDRIGRYGKDLSELTLQFRDRHIVERADVARIQEMADRTITMVDTAIEAFVHRNAESVRNIIEVDDA